jgi:hypothetical protein
MFETQLCDHANLEYFDKVEKSEFNHRADRHFESSQRFEIIVFHLSDRSDEISSQREQIFISHQSVLESRERRKLSTC